MNGSVQSGFMPASTTPPSGDQGILTGPLRGELLPLITTPIPRSEEEFHSASIDSGGEPTVVDVAMQIQSIREIDEADQV